MKKVTWFLLLVVLMPAAAFAQSGRLLAVLGGNYQDSVEAGQLIQIDPSTGAVQVIGTPIPGVALTGLDVNSKGELWATTGSGIDEGRLIQIDPNTGALLYSVTLVGPFGSPRMQDIAIQPGTDTIFGAVAGKAGGFLPNDLVTIDPSTGVATSISGGPIYNGAYVSIAFAPDGTFYGFFDEIGELRILDPSNGSTISSVPVSPKTGQMGFGAASDGIGYFSECCTGYPLLGNDVYTIDLSTGTVAYQSSVGGTRAIHDFALLPNAASTVPVDAPWMLGLLAVALALAGVAIAARR